MIKTQPSPKFGMSALKISYLWEFNLFLFDGEQVKELAEQEAPPPVVFEAIRALLGLELAERLSVDIDILVNRKRSLRTPRNL